MFIKAALFIFGSMPLLFLVLLLCKVQGANHWYSLQEGLVLNPLFITAYLLIYRRLTKLSGPNYDAEVEKSNRETLKFFLIIIQHLVVFSIFIIIFYL